MGSTLRKLKRGRETIAFPVRQNGKAADQIMQAWNRGFDAGAKEQRKSDIEHLVKILEDLEEIPGIGEKTAWKMRGFFMQSFKSQE
ncbi:hypothetical protein [Bacillus methanolicus]|uniref:Helix-hairpin-helix DNA-binding motif class 1 domain-containing protein n=1 Tax=Bacillus methanolicus (strain MGA3 / ATCC 53907) TaxID=796606 RepID=I3E2U2_BACMM|nr:hypothetical protein [Bacillus methanolicus]AIE59090.1 hypothetical protein BMMGA3_03150 [Bacillus methanolicus MGA3]EIJ80813.1 hypothetical protein MGA3_10940 [Bacillus methanolicus MGA3]